MLNCYVNHGLFLLRAQFICPKDSVIFCGEMPLQLCFNAIHAVKMTNDDGRGSIVPYG